VAGEGKLQAAAEREAADRRDQRLGHRVLLVVELGQLGLLAGLVEFADVRAAGKRLRRADQHRPLYGRIAFGLLQVFHDRGAQGVAEAVHGRVVQGDDGDAVTDGIVNNALRRFAHSWISRGIGILAASGRLQSPRGMRRTWSNPRRSPCCA